VTCDESGRFFVTDGGKACIYKLENGKFVEWLKGDWLNGVNGILALKDKVYVGTFNDGSLRTIDTHSKEINTLLTLGPKVVIDGLRSDGKRNLLISDYAGRLIRVSPEGKTELLLNTKSRQITLADFEFIPEKSIVVIPTFTDNRVMMYKVTR
jgi:hypothetical protein